MDTGGASPGGASELGEAILDVAMALVRLSVLLGEADSSAWHDCRARIALLRSAVDALPAGPIQSRSVGFKP